MGGLPRVSQGGSEMCHGARVLRDQLHLVIVTCVYIFDAAISLLGEPSLEGVKMPDPAFAACMRRLLESLGVGDEEDDPAGFTD